MTTAVLSLLMHILSFGLVASAFKLLFRCNLTLGRASPFPADVAAFQQRCRSSSTVHVTARIPLAAACLSADATAHLARLISAIQHAEARVLPDLLPGLHAADVPTVQVSDLVPGCS